VLFRSGEVIGVVNVAIDITDRKIMEKELIKAKDMAEIGQKTKKEFLSNMRHDFRTPFSGILSISQFLEANESDETKKSFLKDIETSSESLLKHINDILEYVHLDKQTALVREEFETSVLLNDIYNMLSPVANEKNIDFKFFINKDFPKKLIGDALKTTQVLLHLLSNAVKFTQEGSVELYISWMNGVAQFVISDTGIGIPKDKHEDILNPFSRLTSSYSGVYEGKGLGLAIVKDILEEIDGQFKLTSEVGKGTLFKVVIPYQISLLDTVQLDFMKENVISITNENRKSRDFKKS
jgi:signal transduction histidine kinase